MGESPLEGCGLWQKARFWLLGLSATRARNIEFGDHPRAKQREVARSSHNRRHTSVTVSGRDGDTYWFGSLLLRKVSERRNLGIGSSCLWMTLITRSGLNPREAFSRVLHRASVGRSLNCSSSLEASRLTHRASGTGRGTRPILNHCTSSRLTRRPTSSNSSRRSEPSGISSIPSSPC